MKRIMIFILFAGVLAFGDATQVSNGELEILKIENAKLKLEIKRLEREIESLKVQLEADDPETLEVEAPPEPKRVYALGQIIAQKAYRTYAKRTEVQQAAWFKTWIGVRVAGRIRVGEVRVDKENGGFVLYSRVRIPDARKREIPEQVLIQTHTKDVHVQTIGAGQIIWIEATITSFGPGPLTLALIEWKETK